MKKIICLIAVLAMAAALLTACGDDKKESNNTQTTTDAPVQDNNQDEGKEADANPVADTVNDRFTFNYKGTNISLKAEAAPVLEALGEPKNYTEEKSCAFDGLDKNYTYTSFVLTTYPDGDIDRVNSVTLVDDTVSTNEGICIGDSKAKVEEVYGADTFNGVNAYIMKTDDAQLTIIISSDAVSSIQYAAQFE